MNVLLCCAGHSLRLILKRLRLFCLDFWGRFWVLIRCWEGQIVSSRKSILVHEDYSVDQQIRSRLNCFQPRDKWIFQGQLDSACSPPDLCKNLVVGERVVKTLMLAPQPSGKFWPELVTLEANRLVAYSNASFRQQVFDVSTAQNESMIQPNGVADDVGWKMVTLVDVHARIIGCYQLSCKYRRTATESVIHSSPPRRYIIQSPLTARFVAP